MTKSTPLSAQEVISVLDGRPCSTTMMNDILLGSSYEEALVADALRAQQEEDVAIYRGLPVGQWPAFVIEWDLRAESQHLAFDALDAATFIKMYPGGLLCRYVDLEHLQSCLNKQSRRTPGDPWGLGDPVKVAQVIGHCSRGGVLTPAYIKLLENGEICIAQGNHRLSVAMELPSRSVPILIHPDDELQLAAALSLEAGEPNEDDPTLTEPKEGP